MKSLKVNFIYNFFGNIYYAGCQWGMLIVLTKIGSIEDVGVYSYGLAICSPLILFANMHLRILVATDAANEYRFMDYILFRMINVLVIFLSIYLFAKIYLDDEFTVYIVCVVGLCKVIESVSDVCYGYFQKIERNDILFFSLFLRGTVYLMVAWIFYKDNGLGSVLLYIAILWALIAIFYDVYFVCRIDDWAYKLKSGKLFDFSHRKYREILLVAAPMAVVAMLDSFGVSIPRYFIENMMGFKSLGYFSAISYLMVVGGTVVGAMGYVVSPRMSKYFVESNREGFFRVLKISVLLGVLIGIFGVIVSVFFGEYVLGLIYSREYSSMTDVFFVTMMSSMVWYVAGLLGCGLNATRKFNRQALVYLVSTSMTLLTIWPFVNYFGLVGASCSVFVGLMFRMVLTLYFVKKVLNNKWPKETLCQDLSS